MADAALRPCEACGTTTVVLASRVVYVCDRCRGCLLANLADLPVLYRRLVEALAPGVGGMSAPVSGTREVPLPVRVDVLDLIGSPAPGDGIVDLHGDQWGIVPVIAVLGAWERHLREAFGLTMAVFAGSVEQSVISAVRFLRCHADRACRELSSAPDLIAEVAGVHYQCRRVLGDVPRVIKLGPCPYVIAVVEDLAGGERAIRCGRQLAVAPEATSMRCRGCGTVYDRADWLAAGEAMRSDVG